MSRSNLVQLTGRRALSIVCAAALIAIPSGVPIFGQNPTLPPPQNAGQPAPLLTPYQLDNLVAPLALYPDPLLGQVLAASTYPLEVVELQQWMQQNPNLRGTDLMNAAKQQPWDPSVQALAAFPDVVALLNRDVQWTTDLGNAFLAQQNDVMASVQRMRVRAQQNGRLATTPQQTVTTQTQDGQSAVVIEPADPQVIYVPVYNPEYIWGPPVWGYYPPLWYPAISFGFGFGPGIYLSGYFPSWGGWGWGGWGPSWGWGCGWFGGGLFVNNFFFNHYGFHDFYRGGVYAGGRFGAGRLSWAHDPFHREGVRYANRNVAARFNNSRFVAGRSVAPRTFNGGRAFNGGRSFSGSQTFAGRGSRNFNNAGSSTSSTARGFASGSRGTGSGQGGFQRFSGAASPARNSASNRGFPGGSNSPSRNFAAPARNYSAPTRNFAAPARNYSAPTRNFAAPARNYSAPTRSYSAPTRNFSAPARSFSAPRSPGGGSSGGGARSFSGGGGGGRSFGGGGHSGGGGGHGGGRR